MPRPDDLDPIFVEECLNDFETNPMVPQFIRNSPMVAKHREAWLAMTWFRRERAKKGYGENAAPRGIGADMVHTDDPWEVVVEALEDL